MKKKTKKFEFKIGQLLRWKYDRYYGEEYDLDYGIIYDKTVDEVGDEYIQVCWRLPTDDGDTHVKYKSKDIIRVMERDGESSLWTIVE